MKQVVAIDGPSGAGKTTVAKLIAKELGFDYLDTGALYRGIALGLRNKKVDPNDSDESIGEGLNKMHIIFSKGRVFLNGEDVSEKIRSSEIDHFSSVFSARKIVREFLIALQRKPAQTSDIVVEGRDITTVVFPDAQKKIYLDASVEERAKRRYLQYREKGIHINIDEARINIIERDKRDSNRELAPLAIAADALKVDSSNLSIEQVMKKIFDFIRTDP